MTDQFTDPGLNAELPEHRESFQIDSPEKVGWYASKLNEFDRRRIELGTNYDLLDARIKKDEQDFKDRFEQQAAQYILLNPSNKKSAGKYIDTLQAGRVKATIVPAKVFVSKALLLSAAKASDNPFLKTVVTTEVVTDTREYIDDSVIGTLSEITFDENGELIPKYAHVPGVSLRPESIKVWVGKIPEPRGKNSAAPHGANEQEDE